MTARITLAGWITGHFRMIAKRDGTAAVARRLRKQGLPIEIALAILIK